MKALHDTDHRSLVDLLDHYGPEAVLRVAESWCEVQCDLDVEGDSEGYDEMGSAICVAADACARVRERVWG